MRVLVLGRERAARSSLRTVDRSRCNTICSKMWLENFLLYTVSFFIIIFTITYLYFKRKYTLWEKHNIPYLTPTFPFGNTKQLVTLQESLADNVRNNYLELKKKTSTFGGFFTLSIPIVMVMDPELIKSILTKDFAHFHDRGGFTDEENDPLGAHLVFLRGEKWKNARMKLTPTFTSGKMKMMFHTMLETSKELANVFDQHKGGPIDMKDIFARQATDVIGSCAFGIDCNSLKDPNAEFRVQGKKVFDFGPKAVLINSIAVLCPSVLRLLKIPLTDRELSNFFMKVLRETLKYREENNIQRKDFLDLLIRLKNKQSVLDEDNDIKENSEGITFNELAAHAFVFFGAGFETTSSTLNFCLFELCQNEDIQEKARKEIMTVLRNYEGQLTYEGIMEMKYVDMIFQEVLRKYPPLPVIQRECTQDYIMPGSDFIVKKGLEVHIPTIALHYDPDYFPDPEKFLPERFTEEGKQSRHAYSYLPFGEGPRICIGMRFALLQVKIVLAVILRDFKFKLDPKTVLPIVFDPKSIFISPKNTIWLQAERIIQ